MDDSPLSSLPPELRNQIYRDVLVQDRPIKIDDEFYTPRMRVLGHHGSLALLKTCRQVFSEASAVFYPLNTFVSLAYRYETANYKLANLLRALRQETQGLLRCVGIGNRLRYCLLDSDRRLTDCREWLRKNGLELGRTRLILMDGEGEEVAS